MPLHLSSYIIPCRWWFLLASLSVIHYRSLGKSLVRRFFLVFMSAIQGHVACENLPLTGLSNTHHIVRGYQLFFFKWANSPGWGHISCVNAPGWGRRKRANAPPPGSSPSNRRLYSQATLSVKNQDILNDLSSHFTLARSILNFASFEFATLQCFI